MDEQVIPEGDAPEMEAPMEAPEVAPAAPEEEAVEETPTAE